MNLRRFAFIAIGLLALATACTPKYETHTAAWYEQHPTELAAREIACQKDNTIPDCNAADEASLDVRMRGTPAGNEAKSPWK